MIRFFTFILAELISVLFFNLLTEDVTTSMKSVKEIEAGKDFTVEVTINKGNIESFSRFQQELPAGLTAKPINSANGEFKFSDNKVKLIWMKLPKTEQLTFSYSIHVDQRLKGNFNMGGSFSYIEDNQRKSVNLNPLSVKIHPSPLIDPSLIVDISEFEKRVIQNLGPKEYSAVNCIRQKPTLMPNSDIMQINVLVNKSDRDKFAKIEEHIPAGYIAEPIETRSSIFLFKNQTVKFLWMNLPSDNFFIVSYKLIPKPEIKNKIPFISGTFSYIEGDQTKSIEIGQRDADLTKVTKDNIESILAAGAPSLTKATITESSSAPEKKIETPSEIIQPKKETQPEPAITLAETKSPEELALTTQTKPAKQDATKTTAKPSTKNDVKNIQTNIRTGKTEKTYILQPDTGIYYRIQIAAGRKPVNVQRYFKRFNLKEEVKREQHDGWYKYSIGSFREYKEARDQRLQIWDNTTIDDAFVAAYNNGMRITVQEALMISNQKWYK